MSKVKELDGAEVKYVANDRESFGVVQNGSEIETIKYLAIAIYPGAVNEVYLFGCDSGWRVISDLFYESIEEAIEDAERYYEAPNILWKKT